MSELGSALRKMGDWEPIVDGIRIDTVFYPFMVDGERNPALEWQLQVRCHDADYWETAVDSDYPSYAEDDFWQCRWVAVDVKEST